MSAAVLTVLLRANLAGSAAVLLVLLLRRPARGLFGPVAAYGLWLAAPLFLLATLLPAHAPAEAVVPAAALIASAVDEIAPVARQMPGLAPGLAEALAIAWVLGALATAAVLARRQMTFVRMLGRLEPLEGSPGVLRGQHKGAGPFVLGSLRPKIVTPADFEARFEGEARRLVLAHEGVHLARGDAAVNGLVTALQCLAWFNPLVHLAARLLRMDQEIACDAAVLARHPQARRLYAETLLAAALIPVTAPFGCHWPAAGARSLKERLTMLNVVSVSPLRRRLGLALAGGIALAGAGAVWAASPAVHVVGKPDWVEKPVAADLVGFYPKAAEKARKEGMAVIDCRVRSDGSLRACRIKSQDPAQDGFGAAALKMSARFRMRDRDLDGHPTAGAAVTIPIKFALSQNERSRP